MHRTGYLRPWERASTGGTRGGPLYMFMRMTIGSKAMPIVRPRRHLTRREAEMMMISAINSLRV